MSTLTMKELHDQLKEMIKDMPAITLRPKMLPIHEYQPYADILFNTTRGVEPPRELMVNVLKKRPQESNSEYSTHCGKCGKDWLDHEFGVPAPYCP